MFTTGRIIFAILFLIAFIFLMRMSYRQDSKNHQIHYKDAAKKVAIYGGIAIMVFLGLRLLTAILF